MKTQYWIWAACIASVAMVGCGSDSKDTVGPSGEGVCGDSVWNEGEACDDGNTDNGDGCSSTCMVEYGYVCKGNVCKPTEALETCGNGVIDEGEACDDGNSVSGDGCMSNCLLIESGYECPPAGGACSLKQEPPVEEKVICGDSKIGGTETCDDGNNKPGDGCSRTCEVEFGYECLTPGAPCTLKINEGGCGDKVLDNGEGCDDGNRESDDGCSEYCVQEYGWVCNEPGKPCVTVCGDGVIAGDEVCDDGNTNDGDGCKSDCSALEEGYTCISTDRTYCMNIACGNGELEVGEDCDNGESSMDESASSYGWDDTSNAPYCFLCHNTGYCGDGIVQNGEECDEGIDENGNHRVNESGLPLGGDGSYGHCTVDCKFAPRCGDGIVQNDEECDNGLQNDGRYGGCRADCTFAPYCGDGKVDENQNEVCDDGLGRIMNADGIVVGGGTGVYGNHCMPDCSARTGFCGDGNLDAGYESCDNAYVNAEGNAVGGDGSYGGCNADCSLASYCGDAVLDSNEQCDNGVYGNNGLYGGCNSDCTLAGFCGDANSDSPFEDCDLGNGLNLGGYSASKDVNVCASDCSYGSYCGDGHIDTNYGEECDDGYGNIGVYGGCTQNCKKAPRCGDKIVDSSFGEECDNGDENKPSGYGTCNSTTCTWNGICGDGVIDTANGEECDDGLIVNGKSVGGDGSYDGCTADCKKASRCGDNHWDPGYEDCDGVTGCTSSCMPENRYECKDGVCALIKCGNGVVDSDEECDDGIAAQSSFCHGCSSDSAHVCKNSQPYPCPTNITGKYCAVNGVECILISDLYGDGIVSEGFEECDDGNNIDNDGCSKGRVDPGYVCLNPGSHCYARACGDGILAYGEECDDGNAVSNDGCNSRCKLEEGYRCETVDNKSVCTKGGGCGDGIVQHGEECDDGGQNGGCSSTCMIEPGYECPSAGGICRKVTCGNGVVDQSTDYNTYEQCDLGTNNGKTNSGCTARCRIATGYHCNETGTACYAGVCGDGNVDVGEECDDGNLKSGDGCNAACKIETVFEQTVDGSYKPICGDGITVWDAGEECDDGNLVSGDGCSAQCTIETGWKCTEHSNTYPQKIQLPVTYRDFRAYFSTYTSDNKGTLNTNCKNATATNPVDGCINSSMVSLYGGNFKEKAGHPDFERINKSAVGAGLVKNTLDSEGLPVWQKDSSGTGITANSFKMWYRDYPGINKTIKQNLTLNLTNDANGTYTFESSSFFPLDGLGYGNESRTHNYHFTSHIRTFFKFRGNNERLDFTGDDDVFVFVNGKQSIDLGGCHNPENASFNLDSTNQTKTVNGVTYRYKYNAKYDLYEDGIYAIDFFQAERKTDGSNFKLTLAGFLDMGTSTCETVCGDGVLAGDEQCESTDASGNLLALSAGGQFRNGCTDKCSNSSCGNGQLDSWEQCDYVGDNPKYQQASYGTGNISCNSNTCRVQYCGDGIVDLLLGEQCDAGTKNGGAECTDACLFPKCGDGILTKEIGEECDNGANNSDSATGEGACNTECKKAPYCGDGVVSSGEDCDNGKANSDNAYGENSCTTQCKRGAYCGDGTTNGREKCDKGTAGNTGAYGGCNSDCTLAPRCGDRNVDSGEDCDNGAANNDNAYGESACLANCKQAPFCGDGEVNGPAGREVCDKGDENSPTAYGPDACTDKCLKAGYCGDGILNGDEDCDYGSANDDTQYGGCSTSCKLNGYCGDKHVDSPYETCDDGVNDGSYGGCTSHCMKAPYCGDGIKNGEEKCDYGVDNNRDGVYGGCSAACTLNAFCGDGNVDEPNEECDDGTDNNTGAYGGCMSDCRKAPHCGDGIKNGDEECDYGTKNNTGAYGSCNPDCTLAPYCGDGIKNGDEDCDYKDPDVSGCSTQCRVELG